MGRKIEIDPVTGRKTTGHEWDGIRELNTPLPKWWLYLFYATILWSIGYWIVYPAWPGLSSYTAGLLGYSSRADVAEQIARAEAARSVWLERVRGASVEEIAADPELLQYALSGGRAIFADNCAGCHGAGGQGGPGFPVLADDSWIWGGRLAEIERTIRFGIRSGHPETRLSEMPRFGADGILTEAAIRAVAEYVLSLSGRAGDAEAAARGAALFAEQCAACHGAAGEGLAELGAPALDDAIWLYGGDPEEILAQIREPRHGVMPAWEGRLDETMIKILAVYVHGFGGGQ